MKAILIELTNGSVYVARTEPETGSEDPLNEKEEVILDLHRQLEAIKSQPSTGGIDREALNPEFVKVIDRIEENTNFRCYMEDLGHDDKCESLCVDCRYNIHNQPPTE